MDFWNKCTEKLENRLTQEDFNTWIRPLKGSLVKNTLELVAPNDFILNYVEKNLAEEITSLVKQQSKKDISLVYKTMTKEAFVDKYQGNNKNENSKLVDSYVFDSFVMNDSDDPDTLTIENESFGMFSSLVIYLYTSTTCSQII